MQTGVALFAQNYTDWERHDRGDWAADPKIPDSAIVQEEIGDRRPALSHSGSTPVDVTNVTFRLQPGRSRPPCRPERAGHRARGPHLPGPDAAHREGQAPGQLRSGRPAADDSPCRFESSWPRRAWTGMTAA